MPRYTINEPHPTVVKNTYTHSGRGGAGNHFRAPATTPAAGIPTTFKPMASSSTRFYSGRGGAGNARSQSERHTLSFDEEFVRQSAYEQKDCGYVGRGGAGNAFSKTDLSRKGSNASSHRSSSSSSSVRSGFLARLSLGSKH